MRRDAAVRTRDEFDGTADARVERARRPTRARGATSRLPTYFGVVSRRRSGKGEDAGFGSIT
jgi:hypothetical protein